MSEHNEENQEISNQDVSEDSFRAQIEAELKALDNGKDLQKEIDAIHSPELVDIDTKSELIDSDIKSNKVNVKAEESKYTEIELEQMQKGWDPKHPDGVSAKEFKRVGEIIEAKRAASKEVVELTKTVKQLVEHNKKVEVAAYERAKQELSLKKIEKIQEGDVDAVFALEQEQQKLVVPVLEAPPEAPKGKEISADAREFQEKNKAWMQGTSLDDRRMQVFLVEKIKDYEKMQSLDAGFSDKDAITLLEEELKAKFPSKFTNPNKATPSPVGVSTTSTTSNPTVFSSEEKSTLSTLQRIDPYYKTAEGVKEFTKQVELVRKSRA